MIWFCASSEEVIGGISTLDFCCFLLALTSPLLVVEQDFAPLGSDLVGRVSHLLHLVPSHTYTCLTFSLKYFFE